MINTEEMLKDLEELINTPSVVGFTLKFTKN